MPINLSNKQKRDARVAVEGVQQQRMVRLLDPSGREVSTVRLLKADIKHTYEELTEEFKTSDAIADALIESDPEIDTETFGKYLVETTRVYAVDGNIVYHVSEQEVILNPDGSERERRPRKVEPQNVNSERPLTWTGKFIPKKDAVRKFVFSGMKQIVHINGLTYDFLYDIAKELHEKESFLLLGAGKKGTDPLIFQRGGKGYRGFLEGRIDGDKYCLLLHLSNMELKLPSEPEEVEK